MLRAGQQGKSGRVFYLHVEAGICHLELIHATVSRCLSKWCPRPREIPQKWEGPLFFIICTLYNSRRAYKGDTGRFQPSSGFWGVSFSNQIPVGVIGWTVTRGSRKKGTPGIKNDKALSFVRAIRGRWKCTYFSEGKQFHKPCLCTDEQDSEEAQDGLRHSWGNVGDWCFLIMWAGQEFDAKFQEGEKPQLLPFFLSWGPSLNRRRTDVAIEQTQNYAEVMGSFLRQLDEPDRARPGCCRG